MFDLSCKHINLHSRSYQLGHKTVKGDFKTEIDLTDNNTG